MFDVSSDIPECSVFLTVVVGFSKFCTLECQADKHTSLFTCGFMRCSLQSGETVARNFKNIEFVMTSTLHMKEGLQSLWRLRLCDSIISEPLIIMTARFVFARIIGSGTVSSSLCACALKHGWWSTSVALVLRLCCLWSLFPLPVF